MRNGGRSAGRMTALLLCLLLALPCLAGCGKEKSVPEDFSFALTWNTYGISSYDSRTGRLVKTTDATHPEDYVTVHILTQEEKEEIWRVIRDLDIGSYPGIYDPSDIRSEPSQTLILTVCSGGTEKTVRAEKVALVPEGRDAAGIRFLKACREISEMLMETEEWQALPAYEFLYE